MRFYRNTYRCEGGSSAGYGWFTNRREAEQEAAKIDREKQAYYRMQADDPARYTPAEDDWEADRTDPVAEPIDIMPTKAGILEALCYYASHAENG